MWQRRFFGLWVVAGTRWVAAGKERGGKEEDRKKEGRDGGEGETRGDRRTGEEIRGEGRAREKRQ